MSIRCTMVMMAMAFLNPAALWAGSSPAAEQLDRGVTLFEEEAFEEALRVLQTIDPAELEEADREVLREHLEGSATVAAYLASLRATLAQARLAAESGDLDEARTLLEGLLGDAELPAEFRIRTKARLARVSMLERRQQSVPAAPPASGTAPASAAPPVLQTAGTPQERAEALIQEGMTAISAGDYPRAQALFNRAILEVPDVPTRRMYVPPHAGFDLRGIPVTRTVQRYFTAPADRRVTMNLQLGTGRLIGMQPFRFSGGPNTGVGASGFVQLPNVQRTQIKTTVTAPVYRYGGSTRTFEEKFLVFTLPDL